MAAGKAIANYELLAALTRQMRDAAMRGEWEQLIGIERRSSDLVVAMQSVDAEARLDEAERQRKRQLIAEILADEAEIRRYVEGWMGELQRTMQSQRQEQKLLNAYGA